MKLLLDTHIWIWSLVDPARLHRRVLRALRSKDVELWLSAISVWEFLLLTERGRIRLETTPAGWLDESMALGAIREAPVTFEIAKVSRSIRLPHQDPADRFIVATARVLDLTLVTADTRLTGIPDCRTLANG